MIPGKTGFTATIENAEDTKVYAGDDFRLYWNASDRISLFDQNTANQQYRFTGSTGDKSGSFVKAGGASSSSTSIPHTIAVYPYNSSVSVTADEKLSVSLPDTQEWAERSFGPGANTMVARSSDTKLDFLNACGMLMLKIYGGRKVSSIMLQGNSGELISGMATITFSHDGLPSVQLGSGAGDTIELICADPVPTGYSEMDYTEFWMVVPPVTFSQGFTATIIDSEGKDYTQTTKKSITISRNHVSKMAPFPLGEVLLPVPEAVDLGLPSGIRWASFNVGASTPEEEGFYYAWGETEPKENYQWENYKWCNGSGSSLTKYNYSSDLGTVDNKIVLDPEDDVAAVRYGDKWRMPTASEIDELFAYTTSQWTKRNGKDGFLLTAGNGNSIFLPDPGQGVTYNKGYWASTLSYLANNSGSAHSLGFDFEPLWSTSGIARYCNCLVRAVYGDFVPLQGLALDNITLRAGSAISLMPAVPSNASEHQVRCSSSDESVAKVSNDRLYALSEGTTVLTVSTTGSLYTAKCNVTVTPYEYPAPEAVDLGLSVKWGSFNLGSSDPESQGAYFAWGETEPKTTYTWATYKWCEGSETKLTKYNTESSKGKVDNVVVLDLEDDAANSKLGGLWRMPNEKEIKELLQQCTWTYKKAENGINGFTVTASNGNSIFIPIAGYRSETGLSFSGFANYWSSSLSERSEYAILAHADYMQYIYNEGWHFAYDMTEDRMLGIPVRPVYDEGLNLEISSVSLSESSVSIAIGETTKLIPTTLPEKASRNAVTWSTSNNHVATVSYDGSVKGLGLGNATITVTTVNGQKTATCEVNVVPGDASIAPKAVDLGLPSGTKWASCNLGAQYEWQLGNYYSWGEAEPKKNGIGYSKWCAKGTNYIWTKYNLFSDYGTVDHKVLLDPEDDAATANLGEGWRMPSRAECQELYDCCTWEWIESYDYNTRINGYKITGPNGKSIFLPSTGYAIYGWLEADGYFGNYLSSELYPYNSNSSSARCITFYDPNKISINEISTAIRNWGYTIRPVQAGPYVHVEYVYCPQKTIAMKAGNRMNLEAMVFPTDATCSDVVWTSDNPDVVSVTLEGEATANVAGSAKITATSADGGITGNCTVTVSE